MLNNQFSMKNTKMSFISPVPMHGSQKPEVLHQYKTCLEESQRLSMEFQLHEPALKGAVRSLKLPKPSPFGASPQWRA